MSPSNTSIVFFLLALAVTSSFASDRQFEQGSLSLSLLKDNGPVTAVSAMVSTEPGGWSSGPEKHYRRFRCEPNKRTDDSIPIFTGTEIKFQLVDNELVLDITRFGVASVDAEILALKADECRNVEPRQTIVFKQRLRLPYKKSEDMVELPLEQGYTLRYKVIPQPL